MPTTTAPQTDADALYRLAGALLAAPAVHPTGTVAQIATATLGQAAAQRALHALAESYGWTDSGWANSGYDDVARFLTVQVQQVWGHTQTDLAISARHLADHT
jgi:hypothetical protein